MKIKRITPQNFRPYGRLIQYPHPELKGRTKNLFCIVLKEPFVRGWRIAYLIVRDKKISRLESHPTSFESFEPVKGRSLLFVARQKDESKIECFYLDRPVILNKGVWHGVITVSSECEMKITENFSVQCCYWPLKTKLSVS